MKLKTVEEELEFRKAKKKKMQKKHMQKQG
jgi:hypothetical protein